MRILFVGHDARRTGAPIVLLNLIKWLSGSPDEYEVDLLLVEGGPLIDAYAEHCRVHVLCRPVLPLRVLSRLMSRVIGPQPVSTCEHAPFTTEYDLVICNTAVTFGYLQYFKAKGIPTIGWLHELDHVIDLKYSPDQFMAACDHADLMVVGSAAVANMLRRRGIDRAVEIVHEFIVDAVEPARDPAELRQMLSIPEDAFVVGGCGTIEWRKGVDIFVEIAAAIKSVDTRIRFLWIGKASAAADPDYARVKQLIKTLGVDDRVRILETDDRYLDYYFAMDAFALTSREDAFPLVCLEAASARKPTICFAEAGGMPEFVGADAGIVVPNEDRDAFGQAILALANDGTRLENMGLRAFEKVNGEFSAAASCSRFEELIKTDLMR